MVWHAEDKAFAIHHPDKLFIGGKWVEPVGDGRIALTNPATEEVYCHVAEANDEDIDRAVSAARAAFDHGPWPRMSYSERAEILRALAEKVRARTIEFGHIWTREMGVVFAQAQQGAAFISGFIDQHADMASTFPFVEEVPSTDGYGGNALRIQEPVGVVGAIVPWNSAAALMIIKLTPALLAGCTVIIKASPEAPLGGYLLMEIIEELGLPPGTVNFVTAERASSEHLVRHPGVDKITFTGSTVAGKRIASICGERLARCTLELGGKSAAVVLDDYQVDQVAATLAQSTAFMTNQVCAALSRVVVSKYRHDEMVDALADAFRKIKVGDPYDPASNMGPLAMRRQLDRVCDYIDKGKADGARLATGGGRPAGLNRGYYIEPTVFANVDPNSTIAQEEIFGPVVAVIAAEDEADAIRIANGTQFGLNASIFTNDVDRAQALARELRSGNVGHNAFRVDFGVGFGGVKQSGIGREGGPDGLRAYLESKTVLLRRSA